MASEIEDRAGTPNEGQSPGPAARWRRLCAFLVDFVAMWLWLPLVFGVIEGTTGLPMVSLMDWWIQWTIDIEFPQLSLLVVLWPIPLFYLPFEAVFGRTPGKWIFWTRVVAADGWSSPGFLRVLLRTLLRLVPFEALLVFTKYGALHDYLSRTTVVFVRPSGSSRAR